MDEIHFITNEIAMALHRQQIERYGGRPGIRDAGLLDSALAVPQATFNGQYLHEDLVAMAGAYFFHLVKNHAFVDGNKRIAFAVTIYFLDRHGYALDLNHEEAIQFVLDVASSAKSKDQATAYLREHIIAREQQRL